MKNLFSAWADLNEVISPDRSRFDVLRERLPFCKDEAEARELIRAEDYDIRYPKMPEWDYKKQETPTSRSDMGGGEKIVIVGGADVASVRLDLACGLNPREGFEGVDLYGDVAKHKVDLWKFPWPWADSSVDELHSSHFVEHLPARPVETRDLVPSLRKKRTAAEKSYIDKDFFFAFFDECYRILKPGGTMLVIVPNARSSRAFQDPTHRRFIVAETFLYLAKEWRRQCGLSHYNTVSDFAVNIVPIIPKELELLNPEAQQRRFNENWNTILDWQASLISNKSSSTPLEESVSTR